MLCCLYWHRLVLGELVRLGTRNSFGYGARPSPSACIDVAPAGLVPDAVASVLWPPCSLLRVPSLRSAGLLSSWETCRLSSLLPQVCLSGSGAHSSVQPILLGCLHTHDPTVLPLVPRLTRLLVTLAQSTASRPDLILCSSHGGCPCQTLARIASDSRSSLERLLPVEFSPGSFSQFHLFAYYGSHCADDGRDGGSVCLFLSVGTQVHEVYRYQSFLGRSTVHSFRCRVPGSLSGAPAIRPISLLTLWASGGLTQA